MNVLCLGNGVQFIPMDVSFKVYSHRWLPRERVSGEGWIGSLGLVEANYYIEDEQKTGSSYRAQETISNNL